MEPDRSFSEMSMSELHVLIYSFLRISGPVPPHNQVLMSTEERALLNAQVAERYTLNINAGNLLILRACSLTFIITTAILCATQAHSKLQSTVAVWLNLPSFILNIYAFSSFMNHGSCCDRQCLRRHRLQRSAAAAAVGTTQCQ